MHPARFLSSILAALVASSALAQDGASAPAPAASPSKGYTATINADNVYVRSGPSVSSAYPFGKLKLGDVVEVVEESYGWAKVRTRGPAFAQVHGYVLADAKVTLSPDGKMLTAVAVTDVRAPNIGSDGNPDASYKAIGQLQPGETLPVVGEVSGDREKVHKVALPPNATGWVNLNYVRRASSGESQVIAGAPTAPASAPNGGVQPGSVPVIEAATGAAVDAKSQSGTTSVDVIGAPGSQDAGKPAAEAPKPAPPPVKTEAEIASEKRHATYRELEARWAKVKEEPLGSSEIVPLKQAYTSLLADPACESDIKAMGAARVQQLEIQAEAQARIQELKKMRATLDSDDAQLKAIKTAMEARMDYTVVGVLNASTVYDGNRLPLLFRVTDPASGATTAYVAPKDPNQLTTKIGLVVGIRGTKRFDEALKLNIVDPGTVDILTTRKEPQAQPVDAPADNKPNK